MVDRIRERPNLVVLAADPAWRHDDELGARGAAAKYQTMSVQEIERMTLPTSFRRARNAVLFLWVMENMPLEAQRVALAWGCLPYTSLIWEKTTKTGKPWFGMGRILRNSHERCLVAVRGDLAGYEPAVHNERSSFAAPVPCDERSRAIHSAKPDEFYAKVERLYPHAEWKHEMFARKTRPGWLQYGLELGKLDGKAAQ